ncbi:MAG: alpha/beta hydrolase [Rikenellaceae bacterium]
MRNILLLGLFVLSCVSLSAEVKTETFIYKNTNTTNLKMMKVTSDKVEKNAPAIVLFFGGGWSGGKLSQLKPQAEIFAENGVVAFLADYRLAKRDKATPAISIEDAKSAMRYLRENAKELGINPKKIIASGASAGGHLASATAFITEFDCPDDNLKISPVPNAMILFNPVSDTSPEGYYPQSVKNFGDWKRLSPLHHIEKTSPPAIFFVGTKDIHVPVASAQAFKTAVEGAGARCDLKIYENCTHGFFNNYKYEGKYFKITMDEAIKFLKEIKFIK